jgi:DNA-binding CsgD family transcriptional regulator
MVFFSALACLAMGLIVLTRAMISCRRSRLRLQKIFVIAFVLLFYHLVPSVIFGYFQFNDKAVMQNALWRGLRLAHSLQTPLLVALIVFFFIRLFLLLQRESWRRSWLLLFWGVQLIMTALLFLDAAALVTLKGYRQYLLYDSALFFSLFASYASLIIVAGRAQMRRFSHLSQVQACYLKGFGRTVVFLITLFLATDFMSLFVSLGNFTANFLSVLPVFLLMAACLLFWDHFVIVMYPHLDAGRPQQERFQALIKEFGISNREQEVIQLVCQGKTNKEIEDTLFISMPTVKDHVSSIFRKTGVTNRVQLAAFFHFKE